MLEIIFYIIILACGKIIPRTIIMKTLKLFTVLITLILLFACQEEKVSLKPLTADAKILAFGDSLTYGTGAKKNDSYPAVLSTKLNRTVINLGIPGELSVDGLKRLPALLDHYNPELLILCHGANDILRKKNINKTANNLRQMIQLAHERNINIILIGVPEFGLFLNTATFYQEIATEHQLVFVDNILGKILSDASMKSDPIHPNKIGYQLMAETIFTAMQKSGAF